MARYYTITMKHSKGALIKQFVINAKRLKELAEYVDAISDKLDPIAEAYKKGYIDGSIEILNASCELCNGYPMTANCNNGNCHTNEE